MWLFCRVRKGNVLTGCNYWSLYSYLWLCLLSFCSCFVFFFFLLTVIFQQCVLLLPTVFFYVCVCVCLHVLLWMKTQHTRFLQSSPWKGKYSQLFNVGKGVFVCSAKPNRKRMQMTVLAKLRLPANKYYVPDYCFLGRCRWRRATSSAWGGVWVDVDEMKKQWTWMEGNTLCSFFCPFFFPSKADTIFCGLNETLVIQFNDSLFNRT